MNGPATGAIDAYRELIEATDRAIADGLAGSLVGMMHVHVRRLRQVAIALGHPVAAAMPAAVESRLRASLRTSDRIFQIGHGEFMVLLPHLLSPGHAELAAQRLLREFEHPMQVDGRPLEAMVAIGLAWNPEHAIDADGLTRRATGALESALAGGRRLDLARGVGEDSLLVDDLRTALVNNNLAIEFQPIIALADRRVAAVEALARWHCARRGNVPPERFVPAAEQGCLTAELTRWTLHAGLREYAELQRMAPGIRCAINLSPRAFGEAGLIEQVVAALAIWGVPAQQVVLEVTETAVMEDPEASAHVLRGLRDAGLGIAIDDFGKGYSSFTYLRHFPATALKIDQSFVSAISSDARARRLVASMIELAHGLGIEATCEGVEDAETVRIIQDMGCDYAQGYHFGRPTTREYLMATLSAATRPSTAEAPAVGAG